MLPKPDPIPNGEIALLLHLDDLHPESLPLGGARVVRVGGLLAHSPGAVEGVRRVDEQAMADALERAKAYFGCDASPATAGWAGDVPIVTPWAPVGPSASALPSGCARTRRRWVSDDVWERPLGDNWADPTASGSLAKVACRRNRVKANASHSRALRDKALTRLRRHAGAGQGFDAERRPLGRHTTQGTYRICRQEGHSWCRPTLGRPHLAASHPGLLPGEGSHPQDLWGSAWPLKGPSTPARTLMSRQPRWLGTIRHRVSCGPCDGSGRERHPPTRPGLVLSGRS